MGIDSILLVMCGMKITELTYKKSYGNKNGSPCPTSYQQDHQLIRQYLSNSRCTYFKERKQID